MALIANLDKSSNEHLVTKPAERHFLCLHPQILQRIGIPAKEKLLVLPGSQTVFPTELINQLYNTSSPACPTPAQTDVYRPRFHYVRMAR